MAVIGDKLPIQTPNVSESVASTGTGQEVHSGSKRQVGGASLRRCYGKQTLMVPGFFWGLNMLGASRSSAIP